MIRGAGQRASHQSRARGQEGKTARLQDSKTPSPSPIHHPCSELGVGVRGRGRGRWLSPLDSLCTARCADFQLHAARWWSQPRTRCCPSNAAVSVIGGELWRSSVSLGKHGILAPQRQMAHSRLRIRIRISLYKVKATTSGRDRHRHADRIGRSPGPSWEARFVHQRLAAL